ncbi:unnamed protein product [Mytilus coruscus]|uniref:C2H2-type domain-containing protein n=1 Tax=Mytilus coruscus TaxID=42192 RepID=A0A6J8DZU2_MYTCO|nr:unnamed protein product [Mytilus coruscus]
MENFNQHMIYQLVNVIPQEVLQKLEQLSAQALIAVLHLVKQLNQTDQQHYECEHCGFTTKRKDFLSKNMQRKHDVKKRAQKEDNTNTDSTMVEIKVGMEKRLLSTILLFSFAELLEEIVQQLSKKFCQGCKVEHGSQHRHDCLMDSELDKLEKHFEQAFCEFKYSHILGKYRENVRTLNLENSVVLKFFILRVLFMDTLRSKKKHKRDCL